MDQPSIDQTENDYAAFIAIDWADQKHAFSLQMAGHTKKETGTLEQKPEVIGAWMAKLRERFAGRQLAVAVEQSRGALIHALLSYDFIVIYPLHPVTVAKFREAFKSSGAKSDTHWTPTRSCKSSPSTGSCSSRSIPTPRKPGCSVAWWKTAAKSLICAPARSRL